MSSPIPIDVAILGGGPAGCSAASWLGQMGMTTLLVEREPRLCATLAGLDFAQDWVLGEPAAHLAALGEHYAAQARATPGLTLRLGTRAESARHTPEGWMLQLATGEHVQARALLVATGLRLLRPARYFAVPHDRVLDAAQLTARREALPPGRVLLLGAGDNAAENALFLAERGHQVTVRSRGSWRAQVHLAGQAEAHPRIRVQLATPLPEALLPDDDGVTVGAERFDFVAALLGFEPEPSAFALLDEASRQHAFVAGDASRRWHPCVQTALADGVQAAKQIELALRPQAAAAPQRYNNRQVIHLQGLRFRANLGVLDFERTGPQPIQVDAEVNLGALPVVARDADIGHVLDYRRVRAAIIDECTAEHTDLVEALLGKLCNRLMSLPGVVGVRLKLTKLEIFPDCEVSISTELGAW
ncbi:MAG: FAD-dependent oxidoreductase [Comamonadaceae bacterium]|nr:FAD-dependent oxidoreductase [Comamonadaceae bacterium]